MLTELYIPRLSNDTKITVQKNHLSGQILYRSLDPPKNDLYDFPANYQIENRCKYVIKS